MEIKWNKQNACQRYFTTEDTVTEWNAPVKPANKNFVGIGSY